MLLCDSVLVISEDLPEIRALLLQKISGKSLVMTVMSMVRMVMGGRSCFVHILLDIFWLFSTLGKLQMVLWGGRV